MTCGQTPTLPYFSLYNCCAMGVSRAGVAASAALIGHEAGRRCSVDSSRHQATSVPVMEVWDPSTARKAQMSDQHEAFKDIPTHPLASHDDVFDIGWNVLRSRALG